MPLLPIFTLLFLPPLRLFLTVKLQRKSRGLEPLSPLVTKTKGIGSSVPTLVHWFLSENVTAVYLLHRNFENLLSEWFNPFASERLR